MPEECAATIKEMISSKQLSVQAGKIESLSKMIPGISVKFKTAKNRESQIITVDAVVNCMGPLVTSKK